MYCMIRLYVLMFCIWPADLFPTKYGGIIFFFLMEIAVMRWNNMPYAAST